MAAAASVLTTTAGLMTVATAVSTAAVIGPTGAAESPVSSSAFIRVSIAAAAINTTAVVRTLRIR